MVDALTQSFCERCGTRYTFEPARPKARPLGGVRVLGKGIREFALTGAAANLDEALLLARADEQEAETARQLEALHEAFRLCLACRQYACSACWNDAAGMCVGCAPLPTAPEADGMPAADGVPVSQPAAIANGSAPVDRGPVTSVRSADPGAERTQVEVAGPVLDTESRRPEEAGSAGEGTNGFRGKSASRAKTAARVVGGEPARARGPRSGRRPQLVEPLLAALQPGTSLDDAIAAYEAAAELAVPAMVEVVGAAVGSSPQGVAGQVDSEPGGRLEPKVGPEPEVTMAGVVPQVDPGSKAAFEGTVAEVALEVGSEPAPEVEREPPPFVSAPAVELEPPPFVSAPEVELEPQPVVLVAVAQPAAPVLIVTPARDPGASVPAALDDSPATASVGLAPRPARADRRSTARGASSTAVSVRSCSGCGLSLSASARFCRRCGARQA